MLEIQEILKNIQQLDQYDILVRVLEREEVKRFITKLNTDQLSLGLDSENQIFGLYYSFSYADFKQKLPGREAGFFIVDLRLTGEYYRSFVVNVFKNGDFEIDSDTRKGETDFLVKYGRNIEGLTDESFNLFIDFTQPIYVEETIKDIFEYY